MMLADGWRASSITRRLSGELLRESPIRSQSGVASIVALFRCSESFSGSISIGGVTVSIFPCLREKTASQKRWRRASPIMAAES